MGFFSTINKGLKTITGIQAYQDRKEANRLKDEADYLRAEIEEENEILKTKVNRVLQDFGKVRCVALQSTVGPFIQQLSLMKQKVKDKEYEITEAIDMPEDYISELINIEMNASNALKAAGAAGSVAAVALAGVPSAVTTVVGAFASASTGTAISTLSGAAATNATLAWLGGGSIAAGGGGMAAGTAILTTATYATAGVFALAASGIIASTFYSKKLTEAEQYNSEVQVWASRMRGAFVLMEGIISRCEELKHVTIELQKRIEDQLQLLYPLVPCFDTNDEYFLMAFKNTGLLVKSMSELCQVPVIDQNGKASEDSKIMITKVSHVLNKNL